MVYGLIENFRYALQYRGGWRNLFKHMYTVRCVWGIGQSNGLLSSAFVSLWLAMFFVLGFSVFSIILPVLGVYDFLAMGD
jgi:hypothetical protein